MSTPTIVLEQARTRRRRVAGNQIVFWACLTVVGLAILLAIFGPLLAPQDPNASNLANAFVGPVAGHPLGFDSQGRDLLSRLLTGARTSMAGPFLVVLVSMDAGTTLAITESVAAFCLTRETSAGDTGPAGFGVRSCVSLMIGPREPSWIGVGLARSIGQINPGRQTVRYLHTMVRVTDLDAALDFYVTKFGLVETRRIENEKGRFTLIFLAAPDDAATVKEQGSRGRPTLELTYNWDPEVYTGGRNFGHLAYEVDDIYATCDKLMKAGITINRPPRDGNMAFVRSPDNISIEILQKGEPKAPAEPWASMPNTGAW